MIKAVIFDCYGVLVGENWLRFKREHFGNRPELLQQATDLNKQIDRGFISEEAYLQGVADLSNMPVSAVYAELTRNPVDEALFDYLSRQLHGNFKLGILSNAGSNRLTELFNPAQLGLFDAVVLSYEIGITKPEAGAYQAIAERLAVDPSTCLFVDDLAYNCEGAKKVGMQAITFRSTDQFITDAQKLLFSAS